MTYNKKEQKAYGEGFETGMHVAFELLKIHCDKVLAKFKEELNLEG